MNDPGCSSPSDNDESNGGGGGGLFFPSTGGGTPAPVGQVLGVSAEMCDQYLTSYIRTGANNPTEQVLRLQRFLRDLEGFSSVTETGIYDAASLAAVHSFQKRYMNDVLSPWGATRSTGYVYYTTRKKINEVYCKFTRDFPLTDDQLAEITRVRSLGEGVLPRTTPASVTVPVQTAPAEQDTSAGTEEVGAVSKDATSATVGNAVPTQGSGFFKKLWGKLFGN